MLKNLRNDVNQLKDKSKVTDDNHLKLKDNHEKFKQQTDKTLDESKLKTYDKNIFSQEFAERAQ